MKLRTRSARPFRDDLDDAIEYVNVTTKFQGFENGHRSGSEFADEQIAKLAAKAVPGQNRADGCGEFVNDGFIDRHTLK